jgi:3-hydroxybutyrate dehydrogenase
MDSVASTPIAAQPSQPRALRGRTALVTGSTRGIGAGIAASLAEAGCDLVLNGRTPSEEGVALARLLADAHGVDSAYCAADLRRADHIGVLAHFAEDRFGRIDILVNNAGVQHVCPVADFTDERWEEVLSLNLSAAFRTTKAVLGGMRERSWGRIINVASVHGLVASEHKAAYVAAKHGLVGLTKVVAIETANDGITCNAICPGWVRTELVQRQLDTRAFSQGSTADEAVRSLLQSKQPMHQFSTVESVGALAVFLCSDLACTMTGTAISMDGGWAAI